MGGDLAYLETVDKATAMAPRTAPPATTLFNKFLRDGETEAASAAGIMGLLKAPAALTTRAACNFSIWFILEATRFC